MNYVVLEMQTNAEGATACLVESFTDRQAAEQKYHYVLSFAAVSGLPRHTCMMVTDAGQYMKSESYENMPEPAEEEQPAQTTPDDTLPDYDY